MSKAAPHRTLAEALHSGEFREALPRLFTFAAHLLGKVGWAEGRDHLPSAAEAREIVNETIERCLDGTRTWKDDVPLEAFLCGVIRSVVSHRKESFEERRISGTEIVIEPMAPSSRRDERLAAYALLSRIKAAIAGDPEMEALFSTIKAGVDTRAEQAAALGWTPERVKAVNARMQRRLAAAGLDKEEDDDGSQRDGGPRSAPPPRGLPRRSAA